MKNSIVFVLGLCVAGCLGVLADGDKSIAAGAVVSTKDILERPVGLINKNDVIFGNNVFVARSKLIFTANDRFALIKKVEVELKKEADATTAVLTKNVLRAVSAPHTDAVLMSKASAVVAAKGADPKMLASKIADFVDTAAKLEMERETKQEASIPNDVMVLIGTKSVLSQPAAVVNKNIAMSDNQVTLSRSRIAPTSNDQVTLKDDAKVSDVIAPQSRIRLGSIKVTKTTTEHEKEKAAAVQYRTQFMYRKEGKHGQKEFWGLGWRYPMNRWGLGFGGCGFGGCGFGFGGGCGLGIASGPWFYC